MRASTPVREGSPPRYVQLASTLFEEIRANRYPVGTLLPTEQTLCEQFGVSRFTIREAIKLLVRQGMVTRQAGVGTRVQAIEPASQYVQTMSGISDLSQYAVETSLHLIAKDIEVLDNQTALDLAATPGETWLCIKGLRFAPKQRLPMAYTEVYIAPRFRSLSLPDSVLSRPLYTYIEEQYGTKISSVTQDIRAVALGRVVAEALDAPVRSPGLWLRRGYFDERGELVEQATNIHTSDRFTYRETFRRDYLVNSRV